MRPSGATTTTTSIPSSSTCSATTAAGFGARTTTWASPTTPACWPSPRPCPSARPAPLSPMAARRSSPWRTASPAAVPGHRRPRPHRRDSLQLEGGPHGDPRRAAQPEVPSLRASRASADRAISWRSSRPTSSSPASTCSSTWSTRRCCATPAAPRGYRDLVVRVAGFSAYWVEMSKALQDQVIWRTEHSL